MPERNSRELGISAASDLNIQQFQGGGYRPQAPTNLPDQSNAALAGLLQIGEEYATKRVNQDAEEAYLKGGIAAAQGQSAESVTNDPFVAPFAHGGYNDESYRLVQTKESLSFKAWLDKEGHQYAPNDPRVTEALNRASSNTMSAITSGMTARARAEALMSQNKTNETLVTQHNKAYKDYSLSEAAKRYTAQGNQTQTTLVNAMNSGDHATYQAATDKAALYFTDVSNNPELPESMRQEIGQNFLLSLINSDQRLPVENMRQAGILDSLPFDIREKIDTQLRESKNRTVVKDLGSQISQIAFFEQGAARGDYTIPEIEAFSQKGHKDAPSLFTLPYILNLYDQANKGRADKANALNVINALEQRKLSGPGGLYSTGHNTSSGLDLYDKYLVAAGADDAERLGTLVGIGLDLGTVPKNQAEVIGAAVRAIGQATPGQPVNPDFIKTLNLATSLVHTTSKEAPAKAQLLLENLPDDTKGAMSYVLSSAEYGIQPDAALRTYWANNEAIKALPDAAKQRHTEAWRKKYGDAINKEFPRSYFGNFFKGLVGETQRIDDSPLSDNQILTSVWSEMRYQESNPNNLGVSEDDLVNLASANVRSRVIPITAGGDLSKATPLILERGIDVNALFGTTDRPSIGRSLATAYPPANEKLRSIFVWDAVNKQVVNKQVDEFNNSVGEVPVDSNKVKSVITAARNAKDAEQSKANFGSLRKVGETLISIDGRNTAGVQPNVAFAMRDLLMKVDPAAAARLAQIPPGEVTELPVALTQAEREAALALQLTATSKVSTSTFRDATDLILSRTVRHIAPEYINVKAQAAIATATALEGAPKMDKIIKAASKAIDAQDEVALREALSKVQNETLRAELLKTLPTGRLETGTDVPFSAGFSAY